MHSHNHMIKISRDITTVSLLVYQQNVTQLITNNGFLCALNKTTANYICCYTQEFKRQCILSLHTDDIVENYVISMQ